MSDDKQDVLYNKLAYGMCIKCDMVGEETVGKPHHFCPLDKTSIERRETCNCCDSCIDACEWNTFIGG